MAKKARAHKPAPPESTRPKTFAPDPEHPHDPTKMRQVGPQPVDTTGYSGTYYHVNEPEGSEAYGLKVLDEVDDEQEIAAHYGHTHFLRNQEHSWSGTKEDFKKFFEKK